MEIVNQCLLAGAGLATCQSKDSLQALHTARCGFPAFEWDNLGKEVGSVRLVEYGPHLHWVRGTC